MTFCCFPVFAKPAVLNSFETQVNHPAKPKNGWFHKNYLYKWKEGTPPFIQIVVFDQFTAVLGDSWDKLKSRNTSRIIQFPVGSGTVGPVAWTLQPLICSLANNSERGSAVPNVPKRQRCCAQQSSVPWSHFVTGTVVKKTTIIGRFGHQPQTKTCASCRVLDALKGPKLWTMNFMQR